MYREYYGEEGMSIVHFRYLRADVEKMLLKIDKSTKGKIDMQTIRVLYFELGYITGRVDERVKDLIKNSSKRKDYMELLNQLGKRRIKLEGLLERYSGTEKELQNIIISRRYSYSQEVISNKQVKV